MAKEILQKRPETFRRTAKLEEMTTEVGIYGVFSSEGETWKRQRKLTAPAFTPTQVRSHYESIAIICNRLRNKWHKKIESKKTPQKGIKIDILAELMSFTLDIISVIAFGYDLNSIEKDSEIVSSLLMFMPIVFNRITALFPYWRFFHLSMDKKFAKANENIKKLVNDMINEFYQNVTNDDEDNNNKPVVSKKSFIHTILKAREESSGDQLDDKEIYGNVVTLLLAGQDTTANTLSWSMYYLSRHHSIQEELKKEIENCKSSKEFPFLPDKLDMEKNLPLCHGVIKEALRLRGPAPVLFSEANVDTKLSSGIQMHKGDIVAILMRSILTDENRFVDGKKFVPSRWMNGDPCNSFLSNLPFGGGPRTCPGKNLSLLESNMFLSMLCNEFIVRPPDASNPSSDSTLAGTEDPCVKEISSFTMGPNSLSVRIFSRSKL